MKNLYAILFFVFGVGISFNTNGQNCSTLKADFQAFESRCAATGAIKIKATGGTGSYKYKVSGPVNVSFTSTDSITGVAAGTYTVETEDIISGCKLTSKNIIVPGNYSDPRFILTSESVSCDNGFNGIIKAENIDNGRAPFTFSIVAPSAMGVGTTNTTGVFEGLKAGDYSIRLTDSCGGIQTRTISVQNYTWKIDGHSFKKFSCDSASGWIRVVDSRGNVSTIGGIDGMQYGLLVPGADTVWSNDPNFVFQTGLGVTSITAFARDACGNTKFITSRTFLYPSIASHVTISNKQCSTFNASVAGMQNFFGPQFCLYDADNNEVECNTSGIFEDIPYGSYCIKAIDACSDTTITRCFTVNAPVPSVGEQVLISNKICETFDAAITGQDNLTNPQYCLFDADDVQMDCNETGIFTGLPYGAYCIRTTDACTGQVFNNCFEVGPPQPRLDSVILPSYVTCEFFGLDIDGDSLYNPTYCLRDSLGQIIDCNSTGIFDSIPLGSYCISVHDECRDTIIERCLTVGPPEAFNDIVVATEIETCSTFVATVSSTLHSGREFFLYDSEDEFINSNTTGIFTDLPYGSYCVKTQPDCPDTTLITCFSIAPPVPKIGGLFRSSNKTCSTFSGRVTGQTNLTDPDYFLTNAAGDTIATNKTGIFNDLPYGTYCILIKDNCFDTTLQVCGTVDPPQFKVSAIATHSCNYGTSIFNLSANTYPATIYIYNPSDVLIYSAVINAATAVDEIPDLPDGQLYRIIAKDDCAGSDSAFLSPKIAWFRSSGNVTQRCPGGSWADGSGNIHAVGNTNTGNLTVRIIKKDGVSLSPSLTPNIVNKDSIFTFQNMGPGTYVVRYTTSDACKNSFYDTITVLPYAYPNLSRSSAYQCDVNGFSVGAVVTNGVGPFSYEIIGSTPDVPSIVAGPQSSPVFSIDNGHNYSLIRLRALDACGNATLGDASILPLANSGIKVNENCLGSRAVLSVDTVYNATVDWYFKENSDSEDSTYLGDGFEYIVDPLTVSTVGYYTARLELNNGCITRIYVFNLTGDCHPIVPVVRIEFTGRFIDAASHLNWSIKNDLGVTGIIVERKEGETFAPIGELDIANYSIPGQYRFIDHNPMADNYYRLRLKFQNGKDVYSKVIHLARPLNDNIEVYPNPATDYIHIDFGSSISTRWRVELINSVSQTTLMRDVVNATGYSIRRKANMTSGIYILKATNLNTGQTIFKRIVLTNRK